MRALVTGGAGFIGSHLVETLVTRRDEVHRRSTPDLRTPREGPPAADAPRRDIREPLAGSRRGTPRSASTSPRRPSSPSPSRDPVADARSNVPRDAERPRGSPGARGAGDPRVDRWRDLRRNATGRRARTLPGLPLSALRRSRSAPPRIYLDGWNRVFGSGHVVLRFAQRLRATPVGRPSRAGVIAIFLERLATGQSDGDLRGRQPARATSSTSTTSSAHCCSAAGHRGGVFNVGTGDRDERLRAARRLPARGRRDGASGCSSHRAPATPSAACSTRRVRRVTSASPPRSRSPTGSPPRSRPATDPAADRREGMPGRRANPVRVVDHPIRLDRVELAVRPWRTATLVVAAFAAVELVLLVMIGGALLAKPEPAARKAAPTQAAPAVVQKARKPAAPAVSRPSAAELPRRKVTVVVLNGNGRQGAAAAAASRVTRQGLPHRPRRQCAEPRLRDVARHVPARVRGRGAASRARPRREGREPAGRRPAERSSTARTPFSSSAASCPTHGRCERG